MRKHLSAFWIIVWLTFPALSFGACRTTFESFRCQDEQQAPLQDPAVNAKPPARQPWLTPFRTAELALAGGFAADVGSSWGCVESNPLIRSADGRFGAKGLAIKAGITGGGILVAHLLARKFPRLEKPLAFAFGGSAVWLNGVALRNRSVGCRR